MNPRLYLETTIPSYLDARRSRDLILAGQQEATREWWEHGREGYELFVSAFVEIEAGRGDAKMAAARMAAIEPLPRLPVTDSSRQLAADILATGLIPASGAVDASHIAVATSTAWKFYSRGIAHTSTTSPSAGASRKSAHGRATNAR